MTNRLSDPAFFLATWAGSGLAPRAPGTVGSLAALPVAALLVWWGGPIALLVGAVALYGLGLWACNRLIAAGGEKDPGHIVIDEVVGVWLAVIPAGLDWRLLALGFVLFRAFDILKPWPISWADQKLPGAHGIMLDDVLAGLFAMLVTFGLATWIVR